MTLTILLIGCVLALAAGVLLLPARRAVDELEDPTRATPMVPAPTQRTDVDLGIVLTEVSTLLRAGAPTERAWSRVLVRHGLGSAAQIQDDGVPRALSILAGQPAPRWLPRRQEGRWLWTPPHLGGAKSRTRWQERHAALPGAIAACRLSAALGAPLAGILESVASGVAEAGRAEASRRTALSGPRSTARLLTALPPVGLILGWLIGARPQDILGDGGGGSMLGVLGIGLMGLGQQITNRLVQAAHSDTEGIDEAVVLDLAAAALAAGSSIPGVLMALAHALQEEACAVVARGLMLGAGWEEAWQAAEDPAWRARRKRLEACLRPGWEDGAAPGPVLAAMAASVRAGRQARDQEAAERLAVRLVLPVGLCYLPAFVILGIVPVVASVGMELLENS